MNTLVNGLPKAVFKAAICGKFNQSKVQNIDLIREMTGMTIQNCRAMHNEVCKLVSNINDIRDRRYMAASLARKPDLVTRLGSLKKKRMEANAFDYESCKNTQGV